MIINDIIHVAIRTSDLHATVDFYRDALGFKEVPRPVALTFPGAWLALPQSDKAILHVYAQAAAAGREGIAATDNEYGTVDHIAFRARGFALHRDQFVRLGLTLREQHLNGSAIWQIFVHDPNGIKLELGFAEDEETDVPPDLTPEFRYCASERFFNPSDYRRFKREPAAPPGQNSAG